MTSIKNYYDDPEFKKRHKEYMKEKIKCPDGCGSVTARYNMHHHRKSEKHIKFMEKRKQHNCEDECNKKLIKFIIKALSDKQKLLLHDALEKNILS